MSTGRSKVESGTNNPAAATRSLSGFGATAVPGRVSAVAESMLLPQDQRASFHDQL